MDVNVHGGFSSLFTPVADAIVNFVAARKGCEPELVKRLIKSHREPVSSKAQEIRIQGDKVLALSEPRIGFTDIEIAAHISSAWEGHMEYANHA